MNGDRLKPYFRDRSGLFVKEQRKQEKRTVLEEAKRIIKQNDKYLFLVEFAVNKREWTDSVAPGLLREWRLQQDNKRLQRRERRRNE